MCHNQSIHFEIRNSNRVVVVMFDVSVNDRVRNIRLVFLRWHGGGQQQDNPNALRNDKKASKKQKQVKTGKSERFIIAILTATVICPVGRLSFTFRPREDH